MDLSKPAGDRRRRDDRRGGRRDDRRGGQGGYNRDNRDNRGQGGFNRDNRDNRGQGQSYGSRPQGQGFNRPQGQGYGNRPQGQGSFNRGPRPAAPAKEGGNN